MGCNKKIFLFFTVLIYTLILFPLYASFGGVAIKTGNDMWAHGFSFNNDDLLTYSIGTEVYFDDFILDFDLQSFTDRAGGKRSDLLNLSVTRAVEMDNFKFSGGIGLTICGNMGGEFLQNTLHGFMKIPKVRLAYDNSVSHYLLTRFYISQSLSIPTSPYVYGKFDLTVGHHYTAEVGAGISVDCFDFHVGYSWLFGFDELPFKTYMKEKSGLLLSYTVNKGVFRMIYETNPITMNGNTIILFNPFAEPRFSEGSYSMGKIHYVIEKRTIDSFEYKIMNFFLFTRHRTGANLSETVRTDKPMFGFGYNFVFNSKDFLPFVSLNLRPYAFYSYSCRREDGINTVTSSFGAGIETSVNIRLFKYYSLDLIGGALYEYKDGFKPYLGIQVTFI